MGSWSSREALVHKDSRSRMMLWFAIRLGKSSRSDRDDFELEGKLCKDIEHVSAGPSRRIPSLN